VILQNSYNYTPIHHDIDVEKEPCGPVGPAEPVAPPCVSINTPSLKTYVFAVEVSNQASPLTASSISG
jgi:hypothetical protein